MTNSEAPTEAFGAALRYYDRKILAGFQHIWAEDEDDFRNYPREMMIERLNLNASSYTHSLLGRKLTWAVIAAANPQIPREFFSTPNGDWRSARHGNEMYDAMEDWGYRLVKLAPAVMRKPAFRNGTITEQMPLLQAARLAADAKKLPRHMRPSRIEPQPAISFGGGVTLVI